MVQKGRRSSDNEECELLTATIHLFSNIEQVLRRAVNRLLPQEKDIRVTAVADSIVLTGSVSDGPAVKQVVAMAEAFVRSLDQELVGDAKVYEAPENETGTMVKVKSTGANAGLEAPANQQTSSLGANRVINLLQVRGAQQVMLEVKIAEVSKTLLNRLGLSGRPALNTAATLPDSLLCRSVMKPSSRWPEGRAAPDCRCRIKPCSRVLQPSRPPLARRR